EAPLLHLAIAIGILPGLFDGLAGDADRVLAAAVIALRILEDPLVLGAGGYTPFDSCHVLSAPYLRPYGAQPFTRATSASARISVPRFWRIYLALWLIRRWRFPATPCLILPVAVSLKRFLTPLLVLSLGIFVSLLRHSGATLSNRHGMPSGRAIGFSNDLESARL